MQVGVRVCMCACVCVCVVCFPLLALFHSLLWSPAPPKLSLHPSTIQSHLFPHYQSASHRDRGENREGEGQGKGDEKHRQR